MILVVPYQTEWPGEFQQIGLRLRQALGDLAVHIDHIGSTAVPGLAAKDVIDIPVSVRELHRPVEVTLTELGYSRIQDIQADHVPPGGSGEADQWAKWIFRQPPTQRATNLPSASMACQTNAFRFSFAITCAIIPALLRRMLRPRGRWPVCILTTWMPTML